MPSTGPVWPRSGAPLGELDQARFGQFEAVEEPADLLRAADGLAHRSQPLVEPLRGGLDVRVRRQVPGHVGYRQVAPGGMASIRVRTIWCGSSASGTYCSVIKIMTATGWPKSSVLAASARIFPGSRRSAWRYWQAPLGRALQQRGGVAEHDRVVVDVDDPAPRRDRLGDLVGIALGGQAGPDVEELAQAGLLGQEPDRPAQERPVGRARPPAPWPRPRSSAGRPRGPRRNCPSRRAGSCTPAPDAPR